MTDYFDFTIPEPSNPSFLGKKGIQYRGPKAMLDTVPVANIFCGITANQSGPCTKQGSIYTNYRSKVQIFSSDENKLASWPPEGSIYSKQGIPSQKSVWVILWPIRDVDGNIYNFAPNSYLLGIMVKKTPITWDSDDMSTWNVYLACLPDDDSSPCDNVVLGKVKDYNEMKNTANLYTCDNTNCGSDKKYKKCNPKQRYCIKPYYEKESDSRIEFGTAKFPCVPENASGCPDQIQDGGECKLKCPANFEGSGLISCNIPQDTFRDFGKASCNCKGPSPSPTPKPTPGPSPSPTPSPESRGLSTPAIIGISIGGVVLVIGIGLVIMNLVKKKKKGRKK